MFWGAEFLDSGCRPSGLDSRFGTMSLGFEGESYQVALPTTSVPEAFA